MSKTELSDKTGKKLASPMARLTSFKKGDRANPHGRPKGSLNEVTKFKEAVALFENAILNSSEAHDLIYDPFLGSGTTIIAAERLGRICYGMEIEPRYVQVSIERWQNFTGQKAQLLEKG